MSFFQNRDRKIIAAIKSYQQYRNRSSPQAYILCSWAKFRHFFWSILTGSDIHRDARIATTVRFPHLTGIVIHRDADIGDNCIIMQQVTLGQTANSGAPQVESGAFIGAGAKILGKIRIGQNARVGANAVVLKDIPANATAVGIPARIIISNSKT